MKNFYLNFLYLSVLFFLVSCANYYLPSGSSSTKESYQQKYSVTPPKPTQDAYYRIKHPLQCVPYAREISGIQIRGNAHTWWPQAAGKYQRSSVPKVGSIMVLSKTSRLRYGHLAVVKRIINSRNIEVAHANWGGDKYTRSYIYRRMPVVDTSPNNNWSQARFWNYPSSSFGSIYKVSGFIYPNRDTKPAIVSTLAPQKPKSIPRPAAKPIVPVSSRAAFSVPKPQMKPIY